MPNLRRPPVDYEEAFRFQGSFPIEGDDGTVKNCSIEVDRLPDLRLATGRIVVGDTFHIEESPPLAKRVKPGDYRVERASRKDTSADDPTSWWYEVACMRIVVSRLRPVRWTPALPSTTFSNLISSRTQECCVADAQSIARVCARDESIFDIIEQCNALDVPLGLESGDNLVRSGLMGYGSGPECAFWGIDKNGKPCRLVFDFGVLSESVYTQRTVATLGDLLSEPASMKTRHGKFEARATKHKRGKELRIRITGDSVVNWHAFEFDMESCKACFLQSSCGGGRTESIEFRYQITASEIPLERPVTVKYKTGVRSLIPS